MQRSFLPFYCHSHSCVISGDDNGTNSSFSFPLCIPKFLPSPKHFFDPSLAHHNNIALICMCIQGKIRERVLFLWLLIDIDSQGRFGDDNGTNSSFSFPLYTPKFLPSLKHLFDQSLAHYKIALICMCIQGKPREMVLFLWLLIVIDGQGRFCILFFVHQI